MLVQDYPISASYGQVPGYPLNNGFHQGIDYACPTGTPLIVNGVTIAITNNTGASTGSHCHVGKFVNGTAQDPGVGNGFEFDSAVVYDTGYDDTDGNYVRITADGALWVYLHLKSTLVTKGQILGEEMSSIEYQQLADILNKNIDNIDKRITALEEGSKATHDDIYRLLAEMNAGNKATHDDIYKLITEINNKLGSK